MCFSGLAEFDKDILGKTNAGQTPVVVRPKYFALLQFATIVDCRMFADGKPSSLLICLLCYVYLLDARCVVRS